jgi:HJR/Mrr/RecB family endonuclease
MKPDYGRNVKEKGFSITETRKKGKHGRDLIAKARKTENQKPRNTRQSRKHGKRGSAEGKR